MDRGYHKYRLDDDNPGKGSNKSPPSHKDVSDLMVRLVAVAKESRDGPRKLGELVAWNVAIEPPINVNVPVLDVHVFLIECFLIE